MTSAAPPLLEVVDLHKSHRARGRSQVQALRGVDLVVEAGATLGLVGPSGCGKTTLARCCTRLIEPDRGRVRFQGVDLLALAHRDLRRLRPRLQMVFQDPAGSLDPRQTVEEIVGEGLRLHGRAQGDALRERVVQELEGVGLGAEALVRRPHAFSGGERQRIALARALVLDPDLLILDEPVSALDVSVQAQILNLLRDLQQQRGLGYLLISHDLAVVGRMSDRVAVMVDGRVVEEGPTEEVVRAPKHPRTRALVASHARTGRGGLGPGGTAP